jgi:hypothetical protein
MGSLSKNTQNTHPTKGASLNIQTEISKKRTNFGVFAAAIAAPEMCINRNAPARKRTEHSSIEHSHVAKAELNTGGRIKLSNAAHHDGSSSLPEVALKKRKWLDFRDCEDSLSVDDEGISPSMVNFLK